ncbi:MAG: class I SAM-dependent methyltransferase [Gemmatimonadota bacterium]|nr:class I SAM-dependent methyltransferase [Gemmatimonadota bacterium]
MSDQMRARRPAPDLHGRGPAPDPDNLQPENLHRATIEYYNLRQVHGDMPHKIPRGPAPDLPAEQARMVRESQEAMRSRRVLEVASGTGSATREIAESAVSVTGVEIAPNMLDLAAENDNPPNVSYLAGDAFELGSIAPGKRFDGGFAAGFLHTCPASRHGEFLHGFHARLEEGSVVFMRSSRPTSPDAVSRLFRIEGHEDQFMTRQLSDGSEFVMVENDPTEDELRRIFKPLSKNLMVHIGNYWWWIRYELS